MKILIKNGRVIDPASSYDRAADVAIEAGRILALGAIPAGFEADRILDASGLVVAPGLVDLATRLGEPGHEHEGMLDCELAAAVAGGITSLVCLPDTDPVLDEPGLVEMLRSRAERRSAARVFPLGALTRGLRGEVLTEMVELTESGCIGFSQAEIAVHDTRVLQRAMQYAATFGLAVWLRPRDPWLGKGVAASGPLATRLGLSGVSVAAETVALHTLFELVRSTGARLHVLRISSAAGVRLVQAAKAEGLPITCDVSIHNLLLTDNDIGYFDSRMRLDPPPRQQRDRQALSQALKEGVIDALVSDHTPVSDDDKALPFAQAQPGASGLELLLGLACKWGQQEGLELPQVLSRLTCDPARVMGSALGPLRESCGRLRVGGVADLCLFDPAAQWAVEPQALRSRGRHSPFAGHALPARVRWTVVGGRIAFEG
ncbi:MAG: dihydroorotase [Betaproteobacteria bacterium]|nr:dihydroorotase [Betaproteobacteria bacterium]